MSKQSKNVVFSPDESINRLWMVLVFTAFSFIICATVYLMIHYHSKQTQDSINIVNTKVDNISSKELSKISQSIDDQTIKLNSRLSIIDSLRLVSKNVKSNLSTSNKTNRLVQKMSNDIKYMRENLRY